MMRLFAMRFALVALVALLYAGSLSYPLVFDDINAITLDDSFLYLAGNRHWIGELRGLPASTFLWTYQAFGWHLELFRLGNVMLHMGNALLLFGFLDKLFEAVLGGDVEQKRLHRWLAFIGAVWFAVNPVAVYATAYLIQRSMLLATFFSLGALHCWLIGIQCGGRKRMLWLAAALLVYGIAMFSKEHVVMLPAVMLALTFLVNPKRDLVRIMALAGFAVLLLVEFVAISAGYAVGQIYEGHAYTMLSMQGMMTGHDLISHAYLLSVITQGWLFFKYLLLWLLPLPGWMSVDMHPPFAHAWLSWPQTAGFAGFLVWPAVAIWLLRKGGRPGLAGFAMLWPWLLFLTEVVTVRVQEIFVLYRSYLWMAGLSALMPLVLGNVRLRLLRLLAVAVAVTLLLPAADRLGTFSTSFKLWDDAVRKSDTRQNSLIGRAWTNKAVALMKIQQNDAAMEALQQALELDPWFPEIYANRAVIYMRRGMWREALNDCDLALSMSPTLDAVRQNRKVILERIWQRTSLK